MNQLGQGTKNGKNSVTDIKACQLNETFTWKGSSHMATETNDKERFEVAEHQTKKRTVLKQPNALLRCEQRNTDAFVHRLKH